MRNKGRRRRAGQSHLLCMVFSVGWWGRRSRPTWVLSVRRTASTLSHSGMVPWYKKSEFFLQLMMVIKVCVLPNRGGA